MKVQVNSKKRTENVQSEGDKQYCARLDACPHEADWLGGPFSQHGPDSTVAVLSWSAQVSWGGVSPNSQTLTASNTSSLDSGHSFH